MKNTRYHTFFVASVICCLTMLITSACGSAPATPSVNSSPTASVHAPTASATARPVSTQPTSPTLGNSLPSVTTSCPAPGTARAAVMPPLALGSHQNIVYLSYKGGINSSGPSFLNRYDVTTGSTTQILQEPNVRITEAQVSADGQWILFTTGTQLQLIRMDGQELQTLYCTSAQVTYMSSVQWSPDQRQIIFEGDGRPDLTLYLLDLTHGTVVPELLNADPSTYYVPRTWIDNKKVYVMSYTDVTDPSQTASDLPPKLYILDTSNGANQHMSNLQLVAQAQSPYCWDFDSSYDKGKLFVDHCIQLEDLQGGAGLRQGPSSITMQSGTSGQSNTVYSNSKQAIVSVRVVGYSSTSLLFIIENQSDQQTSVDTSQNGLWKINTDGSGLTRLTTEQTEDQTSLNRDTQYPWSNFSRNGSMYTMRVASFQNNSASFSLYFGSLSGGTPTMFATLSQPGEGYEFEVVGWTTM